MTNPYDVLEINRNATDEEVKKAYRELAKKYHPDNFQDKDAPLAKLAGEKMKIINEAYDAIQTERMSASPNNNGATNFPRVRELIINRRFSEAEIMLDAVDSNPEKNERNAEWFYLKGVLAAERGWFFDAQKNFETAHRMDPASSEYREAYNSMKNKSNSFYTNGGYNESRRNNPACCSNCSVCDICMGFLCLDFLCNCFHCC